MQSAPPVGPTASSLPPPASVTTEQIQKFLDENKQLILAILDNQNSGKLAECAQYQAQLQKNLLYLAAIADAQPQAPAMRPQMIPHAGIPQGSNPYMQQPPIFPPKGPLLHFSQQQVQELQQQMMPPSFQSHMGMRPVNFMNMNSGMHNNTTSIHTETSHGPTNNTPSSSVAGQGNKQDGAASEENHNKNLTTEQGSGDSEPPALNLD